LLKHLSASGLARKLAFGILALALRPRELAAKMVPQPSRIHASRSRQKLSSVAPRRLQGAEG